MVLHIKSVCNQAFVTTVCYQTVRHKLKRIFCGEDKCYLAHCGGFCDFGTVKTC